MLRWPAAPTFAAEPLCHCGAEDGEVGNSPSAQESEPHVLSARTSRAGSQRKLDSGHFECYRYGRHVLRCLVFGLCWLQAKISAIVDVIYEAKAPNALMT
jgi:hypothetical protein